jgi:PD-(D/E)XK endonuclease
LRYDLVIDNLDGTFNRVQCKTGVLKGNGAVVHFRAYSVDGRRPRALPYQGQIDSFGVYCPQNEQVYLVPIAALGAATTVVTLRLVPTRSGQHLGIRFASAYGV